MNESDLKALLKSQQAELDAVLMYKALAELVEDEFSKEMLSSLAADEGRHAAILKSYTGVTLTPNDKLKNAAVKIYKTIGRKMMFDFVSTFEYASVKIYRPYFKKYPKTRLIAKDEARHGKILDLIK